MSTFSPAQIAFVARGAGFSGQGLTTAVAVALAESSGRTDAVGPQTSSGRAVGLWQIMPLPGRPSAQALTDPVTNARAAFSISAHGTSWGPWEAYTNGAYKQYLATAQQATGAASTGGVATPASWWDWIPGGDGYVGPNGDGPGSNSAGGLLGGTSIGTFFDALADPHTWLRAAYVLVGGALVISGLSIMARPAAAKAAKAVQPIAKVIK